jgi:hypothetical protein
MKDTGNKEHDHDGSITDLIKGFQPLTYSFFERNPCNQVSGVRFQVSGMMNRGAET